MPVSCSRMTLSSRSRWPPLTRAGAGALRSRRQSPDALRRHQLRRPERASRSGRLPFPRSVLRPQRLQFLVFELALPLQLPLSVQMELLKPLLLDLPLLLLLLQQFLLPLLLQLLGARLLLHRKGETRRRGLATRALELDVETQLVGRVRVANRLFVADVALVVELEQRPVERSHAEFARPGHDGLEFVELSLEDAVGDRRRIDQDLDGRLASDAVGGSDQALRNDRAEVHGQVHQQLVAPLFREEVDDAIERLVRIVGVQGAEAQVPGLGERDG